jgi:peptidoglycan/xylan/chitin deacetylase (PgdA/CDA1 family)
VGLAWQLAVLARHALKACFFVDPMPALVYGVEPFRRIVGMILAAGQEVQLHLHPLWTGASLVDRAAHAPFELVEYDAGAQAALIAQARDLLIEAGAPSPIAFRGGDYAANDATLAALASLGFVYDSSHNGAEAPFPSGIALPAAQIAPVARGGLIEVPVTVIEDVPGRYRTFQFCALSLAEMRAAIGHAAEAGHAAVTIVSHSFEFATRRGDAANRVHAARFEELCAWLAERRDAAPTAHFTDRPALALGQADAPLPASAWRRRSRQAGQLWSNLVAERAA